MNRIEERPVGGGAPSRGMDSSVAPEDVQESSTLSASVSRVNAGLIKLDTHKGTSGFGAYVGASDIEEANLSREWLIKGVLEQGRVYQVFGTWKSGKSLLVLDICAHLSADLDWAGHKSKRALVIWIAGESAQDTKERLRAFMLHKGISGKDMAFLLRKAPVYLTQLDDANALRIEIDALRGKWPDLPILIVIDTLNRNFGPGASENSDVDMTTFASNLIDVVVKPNKATCLIVHHSGHGDKGRGRGHSSLPGVIDGTLRIEKSDSDPEIVTLICQELRNVKSGGRERFRIDVQELPFTDNFGDAVEAPVLTPTDEEVKQKNLSDWGRKYTDVLHEMFVEYRARLEKQDRCPDEAKVEWRHWRSECNKRYPENSKNARRGLENAQDSGAVLKKDLFVYLAE